MGPRCCQTQGGLVLVVTCFVLVLLFRPVQETSTDIEIEISKCLDLISEKKKVTAS